MSLKQFKPNTPGQRGLVLVGRESLHKGKPFKKLTKGLNKNGGRNNFGHLTSRKQGGGHKRKYRIIDFKRNILDIPAKVQRIEYDPNRSAFIALIKYKDENYSYIVCPQDLKVGDEVISSTSAEIKVGNCLPIKNIPTDTLVHNVEMKPGKGGQLGRSAGTYCQIIGKDSEYAQLKLSSGEIRIVRVECKATVGMVSNQDKKILNSEKQGEKDGLALDLL